MKILMIVTDLATGGAERQVVDLAEAHADAGHAVFLIALTGQVELSISPEVRIECLGMSKTSVGFIRAYARAVKLISDFQADVVHSHMVHANLFARLLRLVVKMPRLICTAHSNNEGGKLRMLAYRLTDGLADLTTNVSHDAVDTFLKLKVAPRGKIIAMHNGIDTEKFTFQKADRQIVRQELLGESDRRVILAVGRFTEAKDYPNLLRAFATVSAHRSDCVLWLVGVGDELAPSMALANSLGVGEKVTFLGVRHDIPALMSGADVFVLSSAWEGFGLVVAEAMACERPVVATDAGGVREVMGDTGWLVPPRDSELLADALREVLAVDASTRMVSGQAGRERVKALYSLDTIVARWLNVYRGLEINS